MLELKINISFRLLLLAMVLLMRLTSEPLFKLNEPKLPLLLTMILFMMAGVEATQPIPPVALELVLLAMMLRWMMFTI